MGEGMIGPRKTLRRGEPTKADKQAARLHCFTRAEGRCELALVAECWGYAPLDSYSGDPMTHGHLCHLKSKRRFGWFESEDTGQQHFFGCPPCHAASHNCDGKPIKVRKMDL